MRIRSVRIDSFGAFRNRRFDDLDPGLTVIYGKNEAGKTTLMEFIRCTLFPSQRRKRYPAPSKSDSGMILLDTDAGERIELVRDGGNVREADGGRLPAEMTHLDECTYRSVFAMTPDDLRDSGVISSGDIRRRFVIVPGGDSIQSVLKSIEDERSEYMSPEKRTGRKIHAKISELKDLDERIAESSSVGTDYSDLFARKTILESGITELGKDSAAYSEQRKAANLRASQESNVRKLSALRDERESLSASEAVMPDDKGTYSGLKTRVSGCRKDLDARIAIESESAGCFSGMDPDRFRSLSGKIKELVGKTGEYSELNRRREALSGSVRIGQDGIAKPSGDADDSGAHAGSRRSPVPFLILSIGMAMAFAGILAGIYLAAAGLAVSAVGLLLILRKGKAAPRASVASDPADERIRTDRDALADAEGKLSSMRKELDEVAGMTGIPRSSFREDVAFLSDMAGKAADHERVRRERSDSERELKNAESDLTAFVSRFGGEERFLELEKQSGIRRELDARISALEESIRTSGYEPSAGSPADIPSEADMDRRNSELSRELGDVSSRMSAIVNDADAEALLDRRASGRSELEGMARRWAVLSLAARIANDACDSIYESSAPDVVRSADRYIGLMTGGRYSLFNDLRESDIVVVSGDDRKREDRWSSGLGDQVKLSLKMAVARELSQERPPILLDDVLLMFDSDRKRGACRALLDLAEDMQVMLFTCDAETRDLMEEESSGKARMIVLDAACP